MTQYENAYHLLFKFTVQHNREMAKKKGGKLMLRETLKYHLCRIYFILWVEQKYWFIFTQAFSLCVFFKSSMSRDI
jgi:hypothetical protein